MLPTLHDLACEGDVHDAPLAGSPDKTLPSSVQERKVMSVGRGAIIVASGCSIALVVRSLLKGPVPLSVSFAALAGYVSLVVAGALWPRLQMYADVLWRGPKDARGVALTFDDGPDPVHTRTVLDSLDAAGVKATFFVIGAKARLYPDVVREIRDRGHLVGVHGGSHDRFLSLRSQARVTSDLSQAVESLIALVGERPRFYRPPVGQTNPRIDRAARQLGLTIVGWSVRARDGIRAHPTQVVRRIAPRLADGAIVLLHDGAERDDHAPAAPTALPEILAAMKERGLRGARLDEWA
jgi:peptidoglycan/xylan/chitin deacetylase (PgdA/CDA1 family)